MARSVLLFCLCEAGMFLGLSAALVIRDLAFLCATL